MNTGILNIGICTVDAIGQYVDEFPPPGGLRTFDQLTLTTGGCATNCSFSLARMGVSCRMIIKVGDDVLGRFVLDEARRHNIDTDGIIVGEGEGTPFTFVCVHRGGQRSFIHTTGTNATLCLDDIDMNLVRSARFCSVSGAMIMPEFDGQQTADLLRQAQEAGAITLLDTVYTDAADRATWQAKMFPPLRYVNYFVPSEPEARALTGQTDPAAMTRALQQQGCRHVVIKLGEQGAFCRDADGHERHVPAYNIDEVVDTTGAGDVFHGAYLVGLLHGWDLRTVALFSTAVSALKCTRLGGRGPIPTYDQVMAFLHERGIQIE